MKENLKSKENTYVEYFGELTEYSPLYRLLKENIQNILNFTDKVVILTHEENELFRKFKLNSKMPKDWKFGDDVFARYKIVGIEVLTKKIQMHGAIKR